ncbi:probable disease resistance protein At1g61300 [Prosopis cineraria]|uniref:probable disease resistance protein At1g61300 n=1 Tax=Prosopis cineraria TaxID=364024 RepID=UPI00240EEEEB|nr:probable disease resistance protein At1g61300 [Prosopis cineraria]
MRLGTGERFLIILDNVWEKLDFEAIGIPLVENKKGQCIVLITTRKLQVCRLMDCKKTIQLKDLNEADVWELFQKYSRTFDDDTTSPLKRSLAQEITKECGGLPVVIAAVASTLKGKSPNEWEEALRTLKDSSLVDIEKGLRNPYSCLRLSYENIEDEIAKSIFLLCSVFPENYEIPIEKLIVFGVGLGLVLEEVDSYQRVRNLTIRVKTRLIDSCLLVKVDDGNSHVKMHDLVRDVALWISKKEVRLIIRKNKRQKALKDDIVRYLWLNDTESFSQKLDCPKLELLCIRIKENYDIDLTNVFVKHMEKLQVLVLECKILSWSKKTKILQFSKSIYLINNLGCLFLDNWLLEDISFIESLNRLESLTLWNCAFNELPKCIVEQENMRLFDTWRCKIQKNPYEVIGTCSQLEVLYFCENKGVWLDQGKNIGDFINKFSPILDIYCIDFGSNTFNQQEFPITRSLHVNDFETCISNETIKDMMQRVEVLSIGRITSCKYIFPDVFQTIGGE